eukprot:GEMP01015241.1.p1 GENE.GEMP01015241.1~~GEMP01015241.1.p1  ORF type:complete len:551 (+),score=116.36 GEMP01015241.1:152-1804(+)
MIRHNGLFVAPRRRVTVTDIFLSLLVSAIIFGLRSPRATLAKLRKVASETKVATLVRTLSREFSRESLFSPRDGLGSRDGNRPSRVGGGGLQESASESCLDLRAMSRHTSPLESPQPGALRRSKNRARRTPPASTFAPTRRASVSSDDDTRSIEWMSRMAQWGAHRVDGLFFLLLAVQCASLLVYVINGKYFFGLKYSVLQWAARSFVVRSWLKVMLPTSNGALVFLAYAVVRAYPLKKCVIRRWRALAGVNVVILYAVQRLYELMRGDATTMLLAENSAEIRELLSFVPPSMAVIDNVTFPLRHFFPVTLLHTDRIHQTERMLFVGNHSLFALDAPFVVRAIYLKTGIWLRPLAEHSWFALPGVSEILSAIGAVDGTTENCDALMESGANLLVYPGGAHEAWKLTTDGKYSLKWDRNPTGFARMAIKHKYAVVCLSCIGIEDAFHPVVDIPISSILRLGGLMKPNNKSFLFKEGSKISLLAPPNPLQAQRLYCQFGHPIWTEGPDAITDPNKLREAAKSELITGIEQLKIHRDHDPNRYVFRSNSRSSL